jgi:uncharacterized protein (UPF0335 family)
VVCLKVLFLDFLYPKGHKIFNKNLIECLSEFSKVTVLSQKDYYKDFKKDITKAYIVEQNYFSTNNRILSRINSIIIMAKSASFCKKQKPDYIFVSSFETSSFALAKWFFKTLENIFIVHHNNTDELKNLIKTKVFKSYMNKVNHIVLEEFIKEWLVNEIGVKSDRIYVVPYPINADNTTLNQRSEKYYCVGLSNSNDEKFIEKIINLEKENETLLKLNKKVILKSRVNEFDNGYLKVLKCYLKKSEYDEYISNCKFIFMPFPSTFCNRMSGTLMDALSNNKIVLGSDIPLIRCYSKEYPNICKTVRNANEFFATINTAEQDDDCYSGDFLAFKRNHSKENILKKLISIFKEKSNAK